MYYLLKPDITVLWSDISEYTIERLVKNNPDFTVDYSRFDWQPAERTFDAGLLHTALRYGVAVDWGLAVAGKYLVPLDHFRDMEGVVRKEAMRDSTNVPHADLFEQIWPGWGDSTRELDQRVQQSQQRTYERAEQEMREAFAKPINPELAQHWQDLGGSLPPQPTH
ncbi:hypothetical protein PP614_04770 [Mycobacteroides abscessus]|uniref:hypothetical protein n=1 Tax=Mycobacteroides abscessus TaxID=36809 RepID=UPI00078B413E|nr:hypothetical protein [Mycobacteroides abscessus]QST89373.1 hypothetical protein PROPHIGD51-1_39 [Mycobacterium phage prophiGD51-1]AMU57214.1 hypothetical protein A3O02_20060 [Mycobacteroides abscessus]AMU76938.1 hypothetical protein A3O06_22025 [Mycobacteroides abscessus]ANO25884.1 hypothetical protein BAB79_22020 [Mycobacteroides abscessus]MBE5434389.1 hypothetical protein [Mycobacteroides abscessus]